MIGIYCRLSITDLAFPSVCLSRTGSYNWKTQSHEKNKRERSLQCRSDGCIDVRIWRSIIKVTGRWKPPENDSCLP